MVGIKIGKAEAAKILSDVNPENAFSFFLSEGVFTGKSALNLNQLCETLKTIDLQSIDFHLYRKDFENWIKYLGDNILGLQIAKIRNKPFCGEETRGKIIEVISKRIGKLRDLESTP
jgi:hypothetical protein